MSEDDEKEILDLIDQACQKQQEAASSPNKTEKKRLESEADELIKQAEEVLTDVRQNDQNGGDSS